MFNQKIVKYWFLFISLLVLMVPVDFNKLIFVPGMVMVWLVFFFFWLGATKPSLSLNSSIRSEDFIFFNNPYISFVISFAFLLFVPKYTLYYSGNTFTDILNPIDTSISNYAKYQQYFEENSLSDFTIQKLPYILIYGSFKFLNSLIICNILIFKKTKKIIDYITLLLILLSFLYLSIGRGTSFELFEIILLLLFTFIFKNQKINGKLNISLAFKIRIAFLGLVGLIYFINNIAKRSGIDLITNSDFDFINCLTPDFCLNKKSIFFEYFPILAIFIFQISGYLVFGVLVLSKLVIGIYFQSVNGLLSIFVPFGDKILLDKKFRELICGPLLDCGNAWVPDLIMILGNFGFIFGFVFIFVLGWISKVIYNSAIQNFVGASLLLFYLLYFVISLPSGNFLTVSSSNQITILLSILWFLSYKKVKHYYEKSR